MESYQEIELQECPICGGAGLMEEENGWCFYVACLDCGSHTAEIRYERPAERLDAAQRAAHLWNIGKVLTDTPQRLKRATPHDSASRFGERFFVKSRFET